MAGDADFSYRKILCNFEGPTDAKGVLSHGNKLRALTLYNGAVLSTEQAKFGNTALKPSGGHAEFKSDSEIELASSPFTMECWLYILGDSVNSNETNVFGSWNMGGNNVFMCGYRRSGATNSLLFYSNNGNFNSFAYTLPGNQWFHFCVERSGALVTFYINGVRVGLLATVATFNSLTGALGIGGGGANSVNGYIDGVRWTVGKLAYGGSFTPPVAAFPDDASDPHRSNVSLLLHGDGADGATTFTDSSPSPKSSTAFGNVRLSTAQSKYGGASIFFDGSGDYISLAANAAFGFGTGDFTVEGWIYLAGGAGADRGIADFRSAGGSEVGTFFVNSSSKLAFWYGALLGGSGTALALSTWYHVALQRESGVFTCYLNGVLEWVSAPSAVDFGSTRPLGIGGGVFSGGAGSSPFNGYMDDIRITKGIARYTSAFTPPAKSFSTGPYAISGLVRDDAGALAARKVRAYRRDVGMLVGEAVSDAVTGAYEVYTPYSGEHDIVVLDDDASTVLNDLIGRVTPA